MVHVTSRIKNLVCHHRRHLSGPVVSSIAYETRRRLRSVVRSPSVSPSCPSKVSHEPVPNRGGLSSIQYVQHEGTVTAGILDSVARWEDGIRVRWSLGASSRAARRSLRPPRHWPLFLWLNSGTGEIVCPLSRGIAAVRKPRGYAISSSSFCDSSSCWNIFLFFFLLDCVGTSWNHSQALLLIYFVVNR